MIRNKCVRLLAFAAAAIVVAGVVEAAQAQSVAKWIEPTEEVVSPHVRWMKPAYGPPLQALFITYRTGMREIVEVSQRFDFDWQIFAIEQPDRFGGGMGGTSPDGNGVEGGVYQHVEVFLDTLIEDQEARLREKLARDYDVIIIGDIKWNVLPDWARKQILDKVAEGTGLVGYIRRGVDSQLQEIVSNTVELPSNAIPAFPHSALPAFRAYDSFDDFTTATVKHSRHGKGHIALLEGYQTARPRQVLTPKVTGVFPDQHLIHYEYYMALLGHVIRFSANTEQLIQVQQPEEDVQVVDRTQLSHVDFTINSQSATNVTLELALRGSKDGTILAQSQAEWSLQAGENGVSLPVQNIPAGLHVADLWVKRNGNVWAYGSRCLKVVSESSIGRIQLDSIDYGNESLIGWGEDGGRIARHERYSPADGIRNFKVGDKIRGAVIVSGVQPGQQLRVSQWDIYGREAAREVYGFRSSDSGDKKVEFKLDGVPPLSVAQYLEVTLISGDEVLDRKRQPFFYRDHFLPWDDVRAWMWQGYGGDGYLNRLLAREMKNGGFDTWMNQPVDINFQFIGAGILEGVYTYPLVYDDPVRPRPMVQWHKDVGPHFVQNELGWVRRPCLTDPEFQALEKKVYAQAGQTLGKFSTQVYDLGSESTLAEYEPHEVCFSDTCVASFREYLREQYGTLDALNAEYTTHYDNWDQIVPNGYNEARKSGPIPLWIDSRRHMDGVWADSLGLATEAITGVAPGSQVGFSASNDPGHVPPIFGLGGSDYWKLAKAMTMTTIYHYPMQLDCIRDFLPRGATIGGGAFGGYRQMWRADREPLHHRWWIWNTVLNGANTIHVWQGASGGSELIGTTMAPDFTFYDFMDGTIEEIATLKYGVGKLLQNFERSNDGVAVLYSRASMLLSNFTEGFPEGWNIPGALPIAFHEAGFQYRMIAPDQLEEGILENDGFRLLYLPYCQALSPAEVQAILRFAERGGTVVADIRPAVADGHGKPYAFGALDELFGVSQNTSEPTVRSGTLLLQQDVGGLKGAIPGVRVDASLKLDGGNAMGSVRSRHEEMVENTPALIVNSHGEGKGILLNMDFSDFVVDRLNSIVRSASEEQAEYTMSLLQGAFGLGGVENEVTMSPYVPGCHVYRYTSGDSQVMGILWAAPAFLPGAETFDTHHPKTGQQSREKIETLASELRPVVLNLPEKRYVYDVLSGEYLGHVKDVPLKISRGRVRVICAQPYKVDAVSVTLDNDVVPQGSPLGYTLELELESQDATVNVHAYRLALIDPDGTTVEHYTHKIRADGGSHQGVIHLSFNENPGAWKLNVTDINTGVVGMATFNVRVIR